jgi:hypothetical protein
LCGPGIGDNAIAVATTLAVAERSAPGSVAERIRVDSIVAGAEQLRAVLAEMLERN